jgi:hypothetical protein
MHGAFQTRTTAIRTEVHGAQIHCMEHRNMYGALQICTMPIATHSAVHINWNSHDAWKIRHKCTVQT